MGDERDARHTRPSCSGKISAAPSQAQSGGPGTLEPGVGCRPKAVRISDLFLSAATEHWV
ncbi:hypothetical protein NJ7G_2095 [Natrinema sp. J7-2]|nr:hypothetical protein NJ7G_2095 [Natrinema sp. J7-2]